MPLDETLIKDAEKDFQQEGERAATRRSFLMAREARRDPMFLTEICGRFEKEIAELGFNLDHENMERMLVMSRRYFQLMVLTAETMAEVERRQALRGLQHPTTPPALHIPPPMPILSS